MQADLRMCQSIFMYTVYTYMHTSVNLYREGLCCVHLDMLTLRDSFTM